MPLDMKAEIGELKKRYEEDARSQKFNALITSESGCGKTFLARTCPTPVHIDCFDPGGTLSLRSSKTFINGKECTTQSIESGDIIADTRFEMEDPTSPTQYDLWRKEFKRRVEGGYFNHIGTYMLDSATTFSAAVMNWVMKKEGMAGSAPRFTKDYVPQKIEIQNMLRVMLKLPCNFILTGHLRSIEDMESGRQKLRFLTTGDGMITIPLLFDELYTLRVVSKAQGDPEYQMLVAPTGIYLARSRLAGGGKLKSAEVPDIRALLKKVGFPANDKPKLSTL